jgi:hypothetical protein
MSMVVEPIDAALDVFNRGRDLLALTTAEPRPLVRGDLCRQALALAVAGVDTYMHWTVHNRLSDQRHSMPSELRKLELTLGETKKIVDLQLENQRTERRGRPWVQVKALVH